MDSVALWERLHGDNAQNEVNGDWAEAAGRPALPSVGLQMHNGELLKPEASNEHGLLCPDAGK